MCPSWLSTFKTDFEKCREPKIYILVGHRIQLNIFISTEKCSLRGNDYNTIKANYQILNFIY